MVIGRCRIIFDTNNLLTLSFLVKMPLMIGPFKKKKKSSRVPANFFSTISIVVFAGDYFVPTIVLTQQKTLKLQDVPIPIHLKMDFSGIITWKTEEKCPAEGIPRRVSLTSAEDAITVMSCLSTSVMLFHCFSSSASSTLDLKFSYENKFTIFLLFPGASTYSHVFLYPLPNNPTKIR